MKKKRWETIKPEETRKLKEISKGMVRTKWPFKKMDI